MKKFLISLAVLCCAGIHFSCDESLPPYQRPENILVSTVTLTAPDTVSVYYDRDLNDYALDDPLSLRVAVKNTFDDLLQGKALVDGRITIQSFSAAPRVFVVQLRQGELEFPPVFQGNIAVPPAKSAEFSTLWFPRALDGNMVFKDLSYQQMDGFKLYGPIGFRAHATTQIFERLQPVQSNTIDFTLWFKVRE